MNFVNFNIYDYGLDINVNRDYIRLRYCMIIGDKVQNPDYQDILSFFFYENQYSNIQNTKKEYLSKILKKNICQKIIITQLIKTYNTTIKNISFIKIYIRKIQK